jgi:hypothetical protein
VQSIIGKYLISILAKKSMKIESVKISKVKSNPDNPRIIKDDKFQKLVQSIKEFPEMLRIRPIVVNHELVVLGGNMRLKACKDAGMKDIWIIQASDLTEEQQKQFVIKDNVGFGEWNWDILANEWDSQVLEEWGLDVWVNQDDIKIDNVDTEVEPDNSPRGSDDDYSVFELVMLHENKLQLLDTLNKVKQNFLFEKQEEALMEIIRVYNNQ